MKINISPFTYLFYALMLLFCHDRAVIASISAVVIHEAAHLSVIALCGCSVESIEVTPIGLTIHRTGLTRHLQDAAIHLAGPLANLSAAAVWTLVFGVDSLLVSANLFFGLLNLLPIASLDGSKALSALLACFFSEMRCQKICRTLSNLFLLLLWLLSAASLLMLDGNPSLLFFCIGLFMAQNTKVY